MTPAPPSGQPTRTVTDVVTRYLRETLGCDRMFTVPGEAVLPLVSLAGRSGIDLVPVRHEAGAGFAALADAWLTGRPGLIVVNRSPGAANVSIAIDATRADPTPLVLVVGTARRGQDPRTGYQSADPEAQLGGIATVITLTGASDLGKHLEQATEVLRSAVPSAVVLAVPQDVWDEVISPAGYPDLDARHAAGAPAGATRADQEAVRRVAEAVAAAERPVVVAGRLLRGPTGTGAPGPLLDRFARRAGVPVLLANKQQDLLDNASAGYAGDVHQGTHQDTRDRLARADLAVFLGDQASEVHLARWHRQQPVLTVHPAPAGAGEHLPADPAAVLEMLAETDWPMPTAERRAWAEGWRSLETELARPDPRQWPDGLDLTHVVAVLDDLLPDDAIIALDAGNFGSWVHRYLRIRGGQRLFAVADGAMGFGVPGALAAVRRHPERTVVAIVGDGGMLMTGNELASPWAGGRAPVVIVADNLGYGAIRTQGARAFPGTDVASELANPDFVRWAESFGYRAERVSTPEQALPAVRRALASQDGYLLHVRASRLAAHANFALPGEAWPPVGSWAGRG